MSAHRITTFYSYKGGVGRSMALANVATILALRQETVLVIDFDLDAPGLHRYFLPPAPTASEISGQVPESSAGVIDLFWELRDRLMAQFSTDGSYDPDNAETTDVCRAIVNEIVEKYQGYTIIVGKDKSKALQFLPAGRFDAHYQDRIRNFEWVTFFETFKEVFDLLRDAWRNRYEHVLIDSRTGLTDIGSITTIILPDRLAVVFTPNEQSLHGGIEIARQSIQMKAQLSRESLAVFPLLARVDDGDPTKYREWLERVAQQWSALFRDTYDGPEFEWLRYFEEVHVPHSASLAYGERIAVKEMLEHRGIGTPTQAFIAFASTLDNDTMASWFSKTPPTLKVSHERALLIGFDADFELPERFSFEAMERVPEGLTTDHRQALRTPGHPDAWRNAAVQIEGALKEAIRGLRGSLHVFVMAPYAAAILVGRFLDEYARAIPVHVHQFDATVRDWVVFSTPILGKTPNGDERWFDDVAATKRNAQKNATIVAIDGSRQISETTLSSLASQLDVGQVVRLRQRKPITIASSAQARNALSAIRRTLEGLQSKHPKATLHIVTTAPVAMMVELGRMLSSSVYGSVVVHQYEPQSDSYFPVLDVMKPFEPVNVPRAKAGRARKTPKKKS